MSRAIENWPYKEKPKVIINKKNVEREELVPLKEKDTSNAQFKDKTFFEKLRYVKSNVTVEPILAGLIIPTMLSRLAVQNLNLDKACRVKLSFGNEICDALIHRKDNLTYYEGEAQKVISSIETWKCVIQNLIPIFFVIYMGAWSDRTGNRKLCILLPIFGEFMVCVSNIVSTYFFYEIPVEVTMLLEALFPAITGNWVLLYIGVFSYISDITSEESRTFRVGLVNVCMTAGIPMGTALSGILLKVLGYYWIFAISGTICLITFLYGFFCLKSNTKPGLSSNKLTKSLTFMDSIELVKETAAVAFKKRQGKFRIKIILTFLTVAIVYGPNHGERIVMYMFVRYRLKWDALKYSFYSTYSIITHSIGTLLSISIFSKRWGYHDSVLTLISTVCKFAGSIWITFVQNDFQMFMVPIIELLNSTTFTSLRSMATKLVPSDEMGKMNSLFSLVETLAALLFDQTYSALYSETVVVFTGAVFIFSAVMTLPPILILSWLYLQHRKETKQRKNMERTVKQDAVALYKSVSEKPVE